jgi:aryl-alcohol dehydrogenase-like predicted oxidoreductase
MTTRTLGADGPAVSPIGLGCMTMGLVDVVLAVADEQGTTPGQVALAQTDI